MNAVQYHKEFMEEQASALQILEEKAINKSFNVGQDSGVNTEYTTPGFGIISTISTGLYFFVHAEPFISKCPYYSEMIIVV